MDPNKKTRVRLPNSRGYATVGQLAEYRDKQARQYAQSLPNKIMAYEYDTSRPITLEEMRQSRMQQQQQQQSPASYFFNLARASSVPDTNSKQYVDQADQYFRMANQPVDRKEYEGQTEFLKKLFEKYNNPNIY